MKILVYGINFAPEPTGIGKYSGDMAAWLAAAGHEVRVIAAPPYYPAWSIAQGYSAWRHVKEHWHGVGVWRAPLWVPKRPTGATRVVHLLSFALLSIPILVRHLFWRPDVVLVVAPAFACAPAAWLAARLCGAKAWLHVQDFEVDAAFRLGLLNGRKRQRIVTAIEHWILRRFDRVSTISSRMLERLHLKGVQPSRVVAFPNWVDVNAIAPLPGPSAYRAELGIAPDAVVAMYSGSMAGKQGLDLLPEAARELARVIPNLIFVLCGDGVVKRNIEVQCADLHNVRLLPLQPVERLGELLNMADVHLLPQHPDVADLVMPSKLTGMLASGRPVLAIADPGTELARVVAPRGKVVPSDDLPAFVFALMELANNVSLRKRLGASARQYAEQHLARDTILSNFENALRDCVVPVRDPNVSTAAIEPQQ